MQIETRRGGKSGGRRGGRARLEGDDSHVKIQAYPRTAGTIPSSPPTLFRSLLSGLKPFQCQFLQRAREDKGGGTLCRTDDLNYSSTYMSWMIAEKILNEIKSWKMIVTLYPFPGMKFQLMIMIARYYHNSDWIFWGWTMIELSLFAPQKSNTTHFEGLGVTKISTLLAFECYRPIRLFCRLMFDNKLKWHVTRFAS